MVICRQYSTSLERRGIWEVFYHWLETGDFLKSEFKTKPLLTHTHRHTTLTWIYRHLIVEAVISAKIKAMQNIELIWL